MYPLFLPRLRERVPSITRREELLSMLIVLKLDNRGIAELLAVAPRSVLMLRHRFRQKIGMATESPLEDFIEEILRWMNCVMVISCGCVQYLDGVILSVAKYLNFVRLRDNYAVWDPSLRFALFRMTYVTDSCHTERSEVSQFCAVTGDLCGLGSFTSLRFVQDDIYTRFLSYRA